MKRPDVEAAKLPDEAREVGELSEEENARAWAEEAARRDDELERDPSRARAAEDVLRDAKARLEHGAEDVEPITSDANRVFRVLLRPGDDGWLVAECVTLCGCISQGRTRDEALANIREAIELCLAGGQVPVGEIVEVAIPHEPTLPPR